MTPTRNTPMFPTNAEAVTSFPSADWGRGPGPSAIYCSQATTVTAEPYDGGAVVAVDVPAGGYVPFCVKRVTASTANVTRVW